MNARAEPERWRTDPALFAPVQPGFARPGTPGDQPPNLREADLPEPSRADAGCAVLTPPRRD